jgi:hypothetical protein
VLLKLEAAAPKWLLIKFWVLFGMFDVETDGDMDAEEDVEDGDGWCVDEDWFNFAMKLEDGGGTW